MSKVDFSKIATKYDDYSLVQKSAAEVLLKLLEISSGAIAGYLNQDFYDIEIEASYIDSFKEIVKNTFVQQANNQGEVMLVFNRIFLVAIKE